MSEKLMAISQRELVELLKKEIAYDIRRAELMSSTYVSTTDRVLFNIPEKNENPQD